MPCCKTGLQQTLKISAKNIQNHAKGGLKEAFDAIRGHVISKGGPGAPPKRILQRRGYLVGVHSVMIFEDFRMFFKHLFRERSENVFH